MSVLLITPLDTCASECRLVRQLLAQAGVATLTLDAGQVESPSLAPDHSLRALVSPSRGRPLPLDPKRWQASAGQQATRLVRRLHAESPLAGVLVLGDYALAALVSPALSDLPFGLPKLLALTCPPEPGRSLAGLGDLQVFQSPGGVVNRDLPGRTALTQACRALAGMVGRPHPGEDLPHLPPLIGVSHAPAAGAVVERLRAALGGRGLQALPFPASGAGGQTLEWFVRAGALAGVLDVDLAELADEKLGGVRAAGQERLTACALRGLPQVICLGGLDGVEFASAEAVPAPWRDRPRHERPSGAVLLRTTPKEMDELAKEVAHKASASEAPVAVLLPRGGLSDLDRPGGPFWWPEANDALFQSLRNWISPHVRVVELDLHLEDPAFLEAAVGVLAEMLG